MTPGEWIVVGIVLAGALIFTLLWWKIADKWADAEHKRFGRGPKPDQPERIVIKKNGEPRA